jgi:putative ABC transport system permease protein
MLDGLRRDTHHTIRVFGRRKSWTAVTLLTLALGIGATTALFSVVDALFLHQLPYREPNRVMLVWGSHGSGASAFRSVPEAGLVDAWRGAARSVEAFARYLAGRERLASGNEAVAISVAHIDPGFLRFAGARTLLGRGFSATDTILGGVRTAMLSERLWRNRFGASPAAIGQSIRVNDTAYTIIGVASDELRLPVVSQVETQLWLPLVSDADASDANTLARLAPDIDVQSAERELNAIAARRGIDASGTRWHTLLERPRDSTGSVGRAVYVIAAAVGLVLLMTCANVAHLLLALGAVRQREMAIRGALGATRGRIARQVLTEAVLLATAGGALGIGFGMLALRALLAFRPATLESLDRARINSAVLLVAIGLALLAALVFGLTSAMRATRLGTAESLRALGAGSRSRVRERSILIVAEAALSALLLVGALVVVRSMIKLERVDPGFDPEGLYAVDLHLPSSRYPSAEARATVLDALIAHVREMPGVAAATASGGVPPITSVVGLPIEIETRTGILRSEGPVFMPTLSVRHDFFAALRIAFVQGAGFSPDADERHEMIINETLARRFWPGESAVGRRFRFVLGPGAPANPWNTVVGVTHNVMVRSLASVGSDGLVYTPTRGGSMIVVRAANSRPILEEIRRQARRVDPQLAAIDVASVAHDVDETIAFPRFMMMLLSTFAAIALVLSAVGLYGVVAYVVATRTREIGVRLALGAAPTDVVITIAQPALALTGAGLVIGLGTAAWGTRILRAALFEVAPTDPLSCVLSAAVLLVVSGLACVRPAREAMSVDPVKALRAED